MKHTQWRECQTRCTQTTAQSHAPRQIIVNAIIVSTADSVENGKIINVVQIVKQDLLVEITLKQPFNEMQIALIGSH